MEFRLHFHGNPFTVYGRYCDAGVKDFFFLVCAANHHSTGVVAYRHQFHTDMERDGKG
jgi:hypothetical protein